MTPTKAQMEFLKRLAAAKDGRRSYLEMGCPAYPMPMKLERAGLLMALPDGALRYPREYQITDAGLAALNGGVPPGIYWSREAGNFYNASNNRGMGVMFYEAWQDRKDEFPEKATTSAGIDIHLTKAVNVIG